VPGGVDGGDAVELDQAIAQDDALVGGRAGGAGALLWWYHNKNGRGKK
jgi:hypothetical protein